MEFNIFEYVDTVINEKKENKYCIKAMERFKKDIENSKKEDYKWYFDEEEAEKIVNFAEQLTLVDGGKKEKIKLKDFQKFILMNINGWRHKEKGYRRFKYSFVTMSRKNSKSLLMSILALFYSNFYPNYYGQIYLVGVKLASAKIVFNEIVKFIEMDKTLSKMFSIKDYKSEIQCLNTHSTIKALGKSTDIDGFKCFLGIVDEYHLHPDNQLYKLLADSMKSMDEALISVITTAGFDTTRPCFQEYNYCKNLLDEIVTNDRYFTILYEVDEEVELFSEKAIYQSNPLLRDYPNQVADIIAEGEKAKVMGGTEYVNYIVKTLNRWTNNADAKYLEATQIKKCLSNKTLKDFIGKRAVVGLDLSQSNDLTSISLVFKYEEGKNTKYFIHSHSFMPSERLIEIEKRGATKIPYRLWVENGLITLTDGLRTDYKFVLEYLKQLIDEYNINVTEIAYDPYNAGMFIEDLSEICDKIVKITQSCKSLSSPTEDFRLNVIEGNVEFAKNDELLQWSLNNAYLVRNSFDEVKIDKKSREDKIDAVDSIIDAFKIVYNNDNSNIDLNKSLNDYFNRLGW